MYNLHKILFYLLLVLLGFLFAQSIFTFIKSKGLSGAIVYTENPEISIQTWFNQRYQKEKDKYLKENFAFRSDVVRLNNQLDYSLFGKLHANEIIVGKKEYLYEKGYINAYYGDDFAGTQWIDDKIFKIKKLQDTLETMGKSLITIIAPGKGTFYPEYFPDKYHKERDTTNYEYFLEQVQTYSLNLLDFSAWFRGMKDTAQYCLYPKTGIHWSIYGGTIAADSMIRYVEELRQVDMPDFYWNEVILTKDYRLTDTDIESTMNLIFKMPNIPMAYPTIIVEAEGKHKPKAIMVADSFYWTWYYLHLNTAVFDNGSFWFYNAGVWPPREDLKNGNDANIEKEIAQAEIVILMASDMSVAGLGWGFVNKAYDHFFVNK